MKIKAFLLLCSSGLSLGLLGCQSSTQEQLTSDMAVNAVTQSTHDSTQPMSSGSELSQAGPKSTSTAVLKASGLSGRAIVAEIIRVPDGEWTNGNPATLDVNVIDALGSDVPLGPTTLCWDNPLDLLCGVGAEQEMAHWSKLPLQPPKAGSRWIVHGEERVPDTESNRAAVKTRAQQIRDMVAERQRQAEVERTEYIAKRNEWDAVATTEKLVELARQADIIVTGKVVSEGVSVDYATQDIQISSTLKDLLQSEPRRYVTAMDVHKIPGHKERLWTREDELIVFLSRIPELNGSVRMIGVALHNNQRLSLVKQACTE